MPNSNCVNLLDQFGDRYRIGFDPAHDPKHRPKDKPDPWMMLILRERGEIYPYGANLLAVAVVNRPITARRLAVLGLRLVQDGDSEKSFVFPVERFSEVAAARRILKQRR